MIPPADIAEALRSGGLPKDWTIEQVQWLWSRHTQLARKSNLREWRERWAFTCYDLLTTKVEQSVQRPSR